MLRLAATVILGLVGLVTSSHLAPPTPLGYLAAAAWISALMALGWFAIPAAPPAPRDSP